MYNKFFVTIIWVKNIINNNYQKIHKKIVYALRFSYMVCEIEALFEINLNY